MIAARIAVCIGLVAATGAANAHGKEQNAFTLYRNSVLDSTMRIHFATFDADESADYNAENCLLTADLVRRQPGVRVMYWCEPGYYRQSRE